MSELIRDTFFGQIIRSFFRKSLLRYPEEQAGFQLPESYVKAIEAERQTTHPSHRSAQSPDHGTESQLKQNPAQSRTDGILNGEEAQQEKSRGRRADSHAAIDRTMPSCLDDGTILVDWYGPDDPANPRNWSLVKKCLVGAMIVLYTFAIYMGSSICTPSYGGEEHRFGISQQVVSLTLSMYVLAYGMGPLLWSPLSEIPSIGRNPPYIITFALYVILIVPTALIENFSGLVVLRFLLGFFGSPCLATGPASLGDMISFPKLPYGLSLWALAATSGPAFAPLVSGFSVTAENWRWSFWEMIWLSGPIWIAMLLFLPETSSSTILLRRARRLRAFTGSPSFKSQSEIDQSHMHFRQVVVEALWRPIQIMILDPSIAFTALYSALIYGIFYSFFEAFPLVYIDMHGFNLGQEGLAFLSVNIGVFFAIILYWSFNYWVVEPSIRANKMGPPERRLIPALPLSFLLPIGLLIFAWTSSPSIPWIAPTIGVAVFTVGVFIVLQCIFLYLPLSYPQYTASLFAGNDVARSTLAAGTIHFSQPLYDNLGVGRGVSLLAGLTVGCIVGVFALWYYGDKLRARSRFAAR